MSLLERISGAPEVWLGEFPLQARYTAGVAGERFLRALQKEAKILGTRCEACEVTYVPGRQFCERCLSELTDWQDAGTDGVVETFTLLFDGPDGEQLETPQWVAFVRIADGGIVHLLGEVEPEAVSMGMPVQAVFKPKAERTGSMLDIAYFKPSED